MNIYTYLKKLFGRHRVKDETIKLLQSKTHNNSLEDIKVHSVLTALRK